MRIIAGSHRGRFLKAEVGEGIRPTSDKVRGAIFNIITHAAYSPIVFDETLRVADIFCGTGALGLEALSRGASAACFIDVSKESLSGARANAAALKLEKQCTFIQRDAHMLPKAEAPFSLLFLDPPYHKGLVPLALTRMAAQNWVAPKNLIVAETAKDEAPLSPPHFILHERRVYGDTAVNFLSLKHD